MSSPPRRPQGSRPVLARPLGGVRSRASRARAGAARRADAPTTEARSEEHVNTLLEDGEPGTGEDPAAVTPGPPLNRRSPFLFGLLGVLGAFAGYGIVLMLVQVSAIILYVVIALFLALGLEPIVARLVRVGLPRVWSVLVVVLGVALAAGLLGWFLVPPIANQVAALVQATPGYLDNIQHTTWVQQINDRWNVSERILQNLQKSIDGRTVTSLFGGVLGVGKAFVDGAVAVFTIFVLTLYFLSAMPTVKVATYKLVPQSRRPRVVFLSEEIAHRVGRYLLAQVCVALLNALLSYLILVLLGLPFPAVLAVVIGLLALVPIVGTLLGGTIITLVALTDGWQTAVIVLAYYVAYHLFETYLLGPRIMSRAVEVPPAITIVAVLAGGTLLGVVGALIAIPVAAGLLLLYHQVAVPRQQAA